MKFFYLSVILIISFCYAFSQNDRNEGPYNPHDFFTERFIPRSGNLLRSADGTPGPKYWQNTASYLIHTTLSEKDTTITGDVTISYKNNSPDKLDFLWLQLDQNLFNPGSRGAAASPAIDDQMGVKGFDRGGYHINGVTITYRGKVYKVQPVISDTRMQIRLNSPLLSGGGKISIKIYYSFAIPSFGSDRMGRFYTKKGVIYQIGQWYPRMCVYDDVSGWNTLPYMGLGEFYCEYGDFDYFITVPAEMIVYGSGDLQNKEQVLTIEEIKRLSQAAKSDKTISIISADEIGKPAMRPVTGGNLTWHFAMKNSRDIAWAASKAMVWDAARINLPSGRKTIAMSGYPPECVGDSAWGRSTEYLKNSIEIYSTNFYEYPWNSAVSIAGNITGMEYPGIIFNDFSLKRAGLWFLVAHEIGHNWFPMIVGSNERKYMWQDEGFNSYIDYIATGIFNHGEYLNDTSIYNKDYFAYLDINALPHLRDPMMTVSEAMDIVQHYQYYGKTAYGLNLLRNTIVGKERFDYAFRKYTETWAFKHPTPYDFFQYINNATGEDLNWFWKEWFFTTWTLDQAIMDVKYVDNDPAHGALITVENKGKMILPVIIQIIQAGGQSETIQLPVEIWQRGGIWTFLYPSSKKIEKLNLDPENVLPDINRKNNSWNEGK